jgi:hypothetical protein
MARKEMTVDMPVREKLEDNPFWSWVREIDSIANVADSLETIVKRLQNLLENQKFYEFLYDRYSYVRGNFYVDESSVNFNNSPGTDVRRLHERSERQIQLPWVKTDGGRLMLVSPDERRKKEEEIERLGTSSKLLIKWLSEHKSSRYVLISEGELVFFALFTIPDFSPSEQQIQSLEEWLKTEEANQIAGSLYPRNYGKFIESLRNGKFKPSRKDKELAKQFQRCNIELELQHLKNKYILFFPTGRLYSEHQTPFVMPVYCLLVFQDNKFIHKIDEIILLFQKISAVGIEYGQQINITARARARGEELLWKTAKDIIEKVVKGDSDLYDLIRQWFGNFHNPISRKLFRLCVIGIYFSKAEAFTRLKELLRDKSLEAGDDRETAENNARIEARGLIAQFPASQILQQIDWLDYRVGRGARARERVTVLRRAIEQDLPPPPGLAERRWTTSFPACEITSTDVADLVNDFTSRLITYLDRVKLNFTNIRNYQIDYNEKQFVKWLLEQESLIERLPQNIREWLDFY